VPDKTPDTPVPHVRRRRYSGKNPRAFHDKYKELNPEQQQCVTLFYLEKKSYREISDITGFTSLQVKSYIQNGKRNLRILIEKKLNTPPGDCSS